MEEKKLDVVQIISYILAVLFIISIFANFFIERPVAENADTAPQTQEVSSLKSNSQESK